MVAFIRREWRSFVVLLVASMVVLLDQCIIPGRVLTFDAHIHITTIAQFASALGQGEFPVQWSNGFAKYGLPLPLIAHQLPIYLGAVLVQLGLGVVAAYKVVLGIGTVLSSMTLYAFLRKYASQMIALASAVVFVFAPYRIINIYIRGAMPEVFASIFVPLVLLGLYQTLAEKRKAGVLLLFFSIVGVILSHPMVFVTTVVLAVPYGLWLSWPVQKNWKRVVWAVGAAALGVATTSYYLLPVMREMRYFHMGAVDTLFAEGLSLSLAQIFQPGWYYFLGHPGPRGDYVMVGSIEVLSLLVAGGVLGWYVIRRQLHGQRKQLYSLAFWSVLGVLLLLLMTPLAAPLYRQVPGFTQLQFPWRMLTSYLVVSSVLLTLLLQLLPQKLQVIAAVSCVLIVVGVRTPQLYSKNSAVYDEQAYYYTDTNLHTQNMNTIWSQNTAAYPPKTEQFAVLDGEGSVTELNITNSRRQYQVTATSPLRMIDYTFYFPGWRLFIDEQEAAIEFQDMQYRGLITYTVPEGEHMVVLEYGMTKLRLGAAILSAVSSLCAIGFFVVLYKNVWLPRGMRFDE